MATKIIVTFNKPVLANSALVNPNNYVLTGPTSVAVTAVAVVSSTAVELYFSGGFQSGYKNYVLTVYNIKDINGAAITSALSRFPVSGVGTRPRVASATTFDATHIDVVFNAAMETTSVETPGNYAITGADTPVVSAASQIAPTTVRLTIPFAAGGNYTVTVTNVIDLIGNVIDPAHNSASFDLVLGWVLRAPPSAPSPRWGHITAFDSDRNVTVLFGGYDTGYDGETWEYDGTDWTPILTAHSPTNRGWHAMAFDSIRHVVVLFGGDAGGFLNNETWEYDGVDWTQIIPATTTPSTRHSHDMCFDSDRGVTVMFGGQTTGPLSDETWEWDGTDWAQKASGAVPKPLNRSYHKMVYDSNRNITVLFGGRNTNETWEWDGTDWVQKASGAVPKPLARNSHGMAFDSIRNVLILFGGELLGVDYDDTWTYDGSDWTQVITVVEPSDRSYPAMSFDSVRNLTVLFGGLASGVESDETWEYGV